MSGATKVANLRLTLLSVYSQNTNQMMLIKSNGGNGTVSNVTFKNFIVSSATFIEPTQLFVTDKW